MSAIAGFINFDDEQENVTRFASTGYESLTDDGLHIKKLGRCILRLQAIHPSDYPLHKEEQSPGQRFHGPLQAVPTTRAYLFSRRQGHRLGFSLDWPRCYETLLQVREAIMKNAQ